MSSVSGDTTESSGGNFISDYPSSTNLSVQSTTENLEIQSPNQDGILKSQQTSSKVSSVLSTISSPDVTEKEDNGSLNNNQEFQNRSVPLSSTSDNLHDQNGTSLKDVRSTASKAKRICRFYKNGFCRNGNKCAYSHSTSKPVVPVKTGADVTDICYQEQDSYKVSRDHGDPYQLNSGGIICKFFARKRYCLYGESCKFLHQVIETQIKPNQDAEVPEHSKKETPLKNDVALENDSSGVQEAASLQCTSTPVIFKSRRACRSFYKYGDCRFGDSCKYRHIRPKKDKACNIECMEKAKDTKINEMEHLHDVNSECHEESQKDENEKLPAHPKSGDAQNQERHLAPKPVSLRNKKRSDMTQDDLVKLRVTEITQLKRKYPKCSETVLPDVGTVFEVVFCPTDPDWRFDVKSVKLNVMIPDAYPEENLQVDLQNEEGILPEKLVRFFNKTTFTWLQDQQENSRLSDEVQLVFRPFVKWLDKTLEDIFIGGLKMVKRDMEAKAAGLEFVTHEELNMSSQNKKSAEPEDSPTTPEEEYEMSSSFPDYEDSVPNFDDTSSQAVLMENVVDYRSVTETPKRGTEVKLRNLELLEAAASLTCSKLSITVQCGRCKMRCDISVAPHRSHRVVCERCHHQQKLVFRPQMLHQFSSVAGYLDLDNCEVIDVPLLTCEFAVQCLPCGRQNFLSGLQYGQCHTTWCLFCHSKIGVSVESTKLNQLQPNVEPVVAKAGQLLKLEKKEKRVKDPTVQEGKPLPENGTCKHYKKSFRWLRFPCCGKTYPCDLCHNEKETDHEMKFGTRMLCGFCAKEQPYSRDRPCISCSSDMTRKTGTYWEGGKGCRDKVKMSKDDKKKYTGTNKTVPKKTTTLSKK